MGKREEKERRERAEKSSGELQGLLTEREWLYDEWDSPGSWNFDWECCVYELVHFQCALGEISRVGFFYPERECTILDDPEFEVPGFISITQAKAILQIAKDFQQGGRQAAFSEVQNQETRSNNSEEFISF
ncbi:MAG: hypothetical protein AAFY11_10815 [Cyanobacteria bacterium J06641_5]